MKKMEATKEQGLQEIGEGAYAAIAEMIENVRQDDDDAAADALEVIKKDPLSVQVRSGWRSPGDESAAEEYEILLSTGGPATRIVGDLDQYAQPSSAFLQAQDWFTPWEEYRGADESILLDYASRFYFGE